MNITPVWEHIFMRSESSFYILMAFCFPLGSSLPHAYYFLLFSETIRIHTKCLACLANSFMLNKLNIAFTVGEL